MSSPPSQSAPADAAAPPVAQAGTEPSRRGLRLLVLALVLLGIGLFFGLGLERQLSLEALQQSQHQLLAWRQQRPLAAAALYVSLYVLITGLSLPGATPLTLAGGALFGLGTGTVLVSFASSQGALGPIWLARVLLRQKQQQRLGPRLAAVEAEIERNGSRYLLSLRLAPVVPYVLVNLLMGLTAMPAWRFYLVSQIGMLPGTLVYVNAGTQLAQLGREGFRLQPSLLAALLLLAALPWLGRLLARWLGPATPPQ